MEPALSAVEGADLLLRSYLKRLKLPTVAANYRKFAQEAAGAKQPYERYLLPLAEAEVQSREENAERKRIAQAHFPALTGVRRESDASDQRRRYCEHQSCECPAGCPRPPSNSIVYESCRGESRTIGVPYLHGHSRHSFAASATLSSTEPSVGCSD
jgi:hypothetical protein